MLLGKYSLQILLQVITLVYHEAEVRRHRSYKPSGTASGQRKSEVRRHGWSESSGTSSEPKRSRNSSTSQLGAEEDDVRAGR